jgi:site-specific recombinase XerD
VDAGVHDGHSRLYGGAESGRRRYRIPRSVAPPGTHPSAEQSLDALASLASTVPVARGQRTLREYAAAWLRWLDSRHSPATTLQSYGDAISAFLTYCAGLGLEYPQQVTVLTLDGYFVWLRDNGKSASTMAHRRSALISLWDWLVHEGFAADSNNVPRKTYPIRQLKKLPEHLEPHRIDEFLAMLAALTDPIGRRDYAAVAVFFYVGLRVAEFASLRVADVDLIANRVRVRRGKGGKDRLVFLPPRFKADFRIVPLSDAPAARRPTGW